MKKDNTEIKLIGIDGSKQSAFLASLGTLRILGLHYGIYNTKMKWICDAGAWRPVVSIPISSSIDRNEFLNVLNSTLTCSFDEHPINQLLLDKNEWDVFSDDAYWLSALRSDIADEATCQLQTVRRDYFIGNLKNIIETTNETHLERTLFMQWDYNDRLDNQSLHLDPSEDRRYAYQWNMPSGDPNRKKCGGMLGANRLAIESFPLFQSFALGDRLTTCGFQGTRSTNTRWTWPIWNVFVNIEIVKSLLAQTLLQEDNLELQILNNLGISAIYRCRRILIEKTINFTPAETLFYATS